MADMRQVLGTHFASATSCFGFGKVSSTSTGLAKRSRANFDAQIRERNETVYISRLTIRKGSAQKSTGPSSQFVSHAQLFGNGLRTIMSISRDSTSSVQQKAGKRPSMITGEGADHRPSQRRAGRHFLLT
uniref:Uncharacterized protein n=1 Tax=Anopheles culicifacies TaxID=139723 RepID=A0A182MVS6_9DIPT